MQAAIGQSAILNSMCRDKPGFESLDNVTFWKLYSIAKWEAVYAVQPASTGNDVRAVKPVPEPAHAQHAPAGATAARVANAPFE